MPPKLITCKKCQSQFVESAGKCPKCKGNKAEKEATGKARPTQDNKDHCKVCKRPISLLSATDCLTCDKIIAERVFNGEVLDIKLGSFTSKNKSAKTPETKKDKLICLTCNRDYRNELGECLICKYDHAVTNPFRFMLKYSKLHRIPLAKQLLNGVKYGLYAVVIISVIFGGMLIFY
jgi:hypothetical protein